jgi:hypothetical protein
VSSSLRTLGVNSDVDAGVAVVVVVDQAKDSVDAVVVE